MPKKRTPVAERRQETQGGVPGPSAGRPGITGRIPALVAGPETGLTWAGEPLNADADQPPEPKGKLDAMTGYSFSTPVWDGGAWVTPAVAGVRVIPAAAEARAARQ